MNTERANTGAEASPDGLTELTNPVDRSRRLLFASAATTFAALTAACTKEDNSSAKATKSAQAAAGSGGTGSGGNSAAQEADVKAKPGDVDGGRDPNNPTGKKPSAALPKDLPMAKFAAGLEVLAVNTYKQTAAAAAAGRLGKVPPAVAEFITTVQGHHQAALDQWNLALSTGGQQQVTKPDARLQPTVTAALRQVKDVTGAAKLALMLEDVASATYLAAIPKLQSPEAIGLAASIQPVDMQHAAVLHFVLGEYPVPDTFAKTEKAATPP
jgi:hypothetical protein